MAFLGIERGNQNTVESLKTFPHRARDSWKAAASMILSLRGPAFGAAMPLKVLGQFLPSGSSGIYPECIRVLTLFSWSISSHNDSLEANSSAWERILLFICEHVFPLICLLSPSHSLLEKFCFSAISWPFNLIKFPRTLIIFFADFALTS